MILFGVVTRQSITALFAATLVPGLPLLIGLIIFDRFMVKRFLPNEGTADINGATPDKRSNVFGKEIPTLSMTVIISGGIYGGVFTPTEAAAVACVVAIFIGFFMYRDLTFRGLWDSIVEADETTGTTVLSCSFRL